MAADATWLANPVNDNFNTGTNWSTGSVPIFSTASFGSSTITTILGGDPLTAMQFNKGAPAYTFLDFGATLTGAGIVNNSAFAPTFNVTSTFTFENSATAGNATITTNTGSETRFTDNATGGDARLINSGGTYDFSGTTGPAGDKKVSAGSIEGSGTFSLGANQLTVGGNNLSTTVTGIVADGGTFGGTGASLVKVGTGTLTLSGVDTYTGGTTLTAGTIAVTNNSAVGPGAVTFNGGTFQAGAAGLSFNNAFVINTPGGTIDTQANTLTLSGNIANGNGTTGELTKTGSGTLILTGASSYTGATNVNAGILQAGAADLFAAASSFSVASGATLNLNNFDQTIGSLGGAGGVKLGSATLKLADAAGTFAGVISGTGRLAQTAGVEMLTGANTYTGGTLLNGGTLVIGNNAALGTGTLFMAAGTQLSFLDSGNFSISNPIKISGDPAFSPLSGTTQTIAGVIADGTSPGAVDVSGAGTLVLSAVNTYRGPTNVNSGVLDVTGSIAASSMTTVAGGAVLTGTGTIGKTQINAGGVFAPGNGTPGTSMSVAGNLALQSGAIYLVQLNPTATTSANVSGTATLAGATVSAQFASGSYVSKQYVILTASGGLGGTTFSGITNTNLPYGASDTLSYDADHAYLNLKAGYAGLNTNQQNVANTLTNYFDANGGIPARFFGLTPGGLTQIDGEVATGGEVVAFQLTDEFLSLMLDPFVYGRLGNSGGGIGGPAMAFAPDAQTILPPDVALAYAGVFKAPPPQPFQQRWTAWGASYGGGNWTSGSASVGSSNVSAQTYGFAAGMDYHYSPDTIFGFALGGGGTAWGLATGLGNGRSDAFQAGVYGMTRSGPAYLAGALAFANHWMTTNRAAMGDALTADFDAQSYGARVEGGYRLAVLPTLGVAPYAALQAQDFHTPSYSESDLSGGGFGLSYASMSATDVRSELGGRFDNPEVIAGMPLLLRARLAWAHDWVSNPALSAAFESLPGTNFVVNGAPLPQNSALTSLGAELFITPRWSLIAKFDGEFAPGSQTYAGSGTLRYSW